MSLAALSATCATTVADDWLRFRGPNGSGISTETDVCRRWNPTEYVHWHAPLPGPGNSSTIVVGERVFVTRATEEDRNRALHNASGSP